MSDKFNLQAPISKEVELKLRYKAESLGMNLTQYVRFIIMQDVMNVVVPEGYKPKETKRKPPNAKRRNNSTKKQIKVEVEETKEPLNIGFKPTNQNQFIINKSEDDNPFGAR